MRILNINAENTTSDSCVAFEVDETPDPKALSMINSDRVRPTFEHGLLLLTTIFPGQRILEADLEEFLSAYRKAEDFLAKQDSEKRAQHDRVLQEISKRLDLPVGR